MPEDRQDPEKPQRTPEAERALAEAEARRKASSEAPPAPREYKGRKGLEPARYGDWEVKGIVSDF